MSMTLIAIFDVPHDVVDRFFGDWQENRDFMSGQPGFVEDTLYRAARSSARARIVNVAHWRSHEQWSRYLYGEWVGKAAGCIGYGGNAGARAVEQLRLVLLELRMSSLRDAVHIEDLWDRLRDGQFHVSERQEQQLHRVLDGLHAWSRAPAVDAAVS